jgi:hypothetical protein
MGFIILPALVPDISAVYDVYFVAFKNNALTRALFPFATGAELTDPKSEFRYVLLRSESSVPLLHCKTDSEKARPHRSRVGVLED